MANEDKKDFNAMLRDSKDMPKIQIITDKKSIDKYGGTKMYFAPPIAYDSIMKSVPSGKLITVGNIREYLAKKTARTLPNRLPPEFLFQLRRGQVINARTIKRLFGER